MQGQSSGLSEVRVLVDLEKEIDRAARGVEELPARCPGLFSQRYRQSIVALDEQSLRSSQRALQESRLRFLTRGIRRHRRRMERNKQGFTRQRHNGRDVVELQDLVIDAFIGGGLNRP